MSGASYLSLTDIGKSGKGRRQKQPTTSTVSNNFGSTTLVRQPSMYDLSKSLGKSSYFSDINPRNMKRLMNILAITGQLCIVTAVFFHSFIYCRHLYSASSSGATQKRSQPQRGRIMLV